MPIPLSIAKLPEVKSAVVSDRNGSVLEVLREKEGESVAAVIGFLSSTIAEAGSHLGLGILRRISYTGPKRGAVVAVASSELVAAFVEPASSLPSVETLLAGSLEQKGA